jgi:ADP-ribosylglycohydrolase
MENKKMFNVMLIKKINGQMASEWIIDAEGFAVEFKSLNQIEKQVGIMKKTDPSIIDCVIE